MKTFMEYKIILIAGGSASGKTFVINKVLENLPKDNILHIDLDDYYNDLSHLSLEERKKVNFDHPKALDWKLIVKQITDLKNGLCIEKPTYDFKISNRTQITQHIEPKKIIIVEGIMALVNKKLRDLGDLKIFINCTRERRLLRRIKRDIEERGRNKEFVLKQYLETVQPMYEEIIGPSSYYADLIINNDEISTKSIDILTFLFKELLDE